MARGRCPRVMADEWVWNFGGERGVAARQQFRFFSFYFYLFIYSFVVHEVKVVVQLSHLRTFKVIYKLLNFILFLFIGQRIKFVVQIDAFKRN